MAPKKLEPATNRLCWRFREPVIDGEQRQFQTTGYADLVENIRQVMLDRVFAERKLARDLLIAETGDDGRQDIHFALR